MASYEKRQPSGLWSVRFKILTPDGMEKQKRLSGFKTKKEAQYAYEEFISAQRTELAVAKSQPSEPEKNTLDMTFSELIIKYLTFKKPRLKAQSYYDVEKKINDKLVSYFGDMRMSQITPLTVIEWQAKVMGGYSYKYQKDIFTHLVSIYNYAYKYHDIIDIMDKVDPPRNLQGKKEMTIWAPEEFSRFICAVEHPAYNILYKFLYLAGCRRGEALALTWNDIDFNNGTVRISKNAAYKAGINGKPYQIYSPKNETSNRTIYLPQSIFNDLQVYRTWQEQNTKAQNFVFGAEDPLPPTSIDRYMKNAIQKSGVKCIRVHDLRHSCASYLIHKGVTIVAVSKHLGHASTKQTLDTYSHLLPDDNSMILSALSELDFSL